MEVYLKSVELDNADDLTELLNRQGWGGQAKQVWDSLSEEEQDMAFNLISDIYTEDEPISDFSNVWDFIAYDLEDMLKDY